MVQRAWVLQERLRSPRILHFGRNEVFFECNKLIATETYPSGLPASCHLATKAKLLPSWTKIVEEYSSRQLTYLSDKLVALSGIAHHLALHKESTLSTRYLAGLWGGADLVRQLAWYCNQTGAQLGGGGKPCHSRISDQTPTWSWASLNAEVIFFKFESGEEKWVKEKAKVLEASTVLATQNQFGNVEGGCLVILAPLNMVPVKVDGVYLDDRQLDDLSLHLDGTAENTGEFYLLSLCKAEEVNYTKDGEWGDILSFSVYLVLRQTSDSRGPRGYYQCCGLAIAEYFAFDNNEMKEPTWDVENGRQASCREFRSCVEGHVIYLV